MKILKKENIWLIEDYEASKIENCNIYIKNDWPHNFNSSQNKKLFACGICNPKLQSKVWFTDSTIDYELACNHIKNILIAQEYSKQQQQDRPWPNNWSFPTTCLEVDKCNLLIDEIKNPDKLQTYFSDSLENIDSLMPYPTYYDTIKYIDFKLKKYQVIKNNSIYNCNCKKMFKCNHIKNVILYEKKKDTIINLVLFLVQKYFESLNLF